MPDHKGQILTTSGRAKRIEQVVHQLARDCPSVKGLDPATAIKRLRAELDQRTALARKALRWVEDDNAQD